jgi:hypothetical protein
MSDYVTKSCISSVLICLVSTGCTTAEPGYISNLVPLRVEQICPDPTSTIMPNSTIESLSDSDTSSIIRAYGGNAPVYLQGRHSFTRSYGGYVFGAYAWGYGPFPLSSDLAQLKISESGQFEWAWAFGGPNNDTCDAVILSEDDGYIFAGTTVPLKPPRISGLGKGNLLLVKTNSDGSLRWHRSYALYSGSGSQNENSRLHGELDSIYQTSDGGYIVAGNTAKDYGSAYRHWDILVAKIDTEGGIQWIKAFGRDKRDQASTIIETQDGGYVLVGLTHPTGIFETDIILIKLSAKGDITWSRIFSGLGQDEGFDIVETQDGELVIGGWTRPSNWDKAGHDLLLMKTDKFGSPLWSKSFDSTEYAKNEFTAQDTSYFFEYMGKGKAHRNSYMSFSLTQTKDEGYAITALKSAVDNVVVLKTDSEGDLEWARSKRAHENGWGYWQSGSDHSGLNIVQSQDGQYTVAGNIRSPDRAQSLFTWQFYDATTANACTHEFDVKSLEPNFKMETPLLHIRNLYPVSLSEPEFIQTKISIK